MAEVTSASPAAAAASILAAEQRQGVEQYSMVARSPPISGPSTIALAEVISTSSLAAIPVAERPLIWGCRGRGDFRVAPAAASSILADE